MATAESLGYATLLQPQRHNENLTFWNILCRIEGKRYFSLDIPAFTYGIIGYTYDNDISGPDGSAYLIVPVLSRQEALLIQPRVGKGFLAQTTI